LVGIASLLPVAARATQPPPAAGATGRYVVVLRDGGASPAEVAKRQARAFGMTVDRVYAHALAGYAADVPEGRLAALRADPAVAEVVADEPFTASAKPSPVPGGCA